MKNKPLSERGIIGNTLEAVDAAVLKLHKQLPILAVMSDAQGRTSQEMMDNMYETRSKIAEKTKLLSKISELDQIRISALIDAAAARMPSAEWAQALKSCFYVSSGALFMLLSGCGGGQDAVNRRANEGRGSVVRNSAADYGEEMLLFGVGLPLAEALVVTLYYKVGALGYGGDKKFDDSLYGMLLGIVVQLITTLYALSEDWNNPIAVGVAAGIGTTTLLGLTKLYIKGPDDKSKP